MSPIRPPLRTARHRHDAHRRTVRGGTECILVVDAREQLASLTAAMLADLGYTTHWGCSRFDALDLLAGGTPVDLLISPSALPTLTEGLSLVQTALARRPGLRVLLTSSSAPSGAVRAAAAPYGLIAKPFGLAKLGHRVRQVLDLPPVHRPATAAEAAASAEDGIHEAAGHD